MPRHCVMLRLPGGGVAMVTTTRPAHACQVCGERIAAYQCDAIVAPRKTCDRHLCSLCRVHAGRNVDFCPEHAAREQVTP